MALEAFQTHLSNYRDATLAGMLSAVPQREREPGALRDAQARQE